MHPLSNKRLEEAAGRYVRQCMSSGSCPGVTVTSAPSEGPRNAVWSHCLYGSPFQVQLGGELMFGVENRRRRSVNNAKESSPRAESVGELSHWLELYVKL